MDPRTSIQIVLNTLGQVEVKGKRNLDLLLSAMIALEKLSAQIGADRRKEEDDHGEDV